MGKVNLDSDWTTRPKQSAARGAASELLACAALMRAGYYVYRCESPAAPFDLVAYRDGQCLRVEVKSATVRASTGHAPVIGWPSNDEWDLAIIVASPDRVFCFDSSTTWEEARDIVREDYGHAAIGAAVVAIRPCGTAEGYKIHLHRNEDPDACPPCAEAKRRLRMRRQKGSQSFPQLRRAQ